MHASVQPAALEEEQIDALLRHLDEPGVSVISAFGRDGARQLATQRSVARTETGLRALTESIVNGHDNNRCMARIRALKTTHRRIAPRLSPEERSSFENRFELLQAAINVRSQFQDATESATPRLLTATAHALAKPIEHDVRQQRIHEAALAMLRRSERSEIARAARDAAAVLVTHQANARLIATALNRLVSQEERLNDPTCVTGCGETPPHPGHRPPQGHRSRQGEQEHRGRRHGQTQARRSGRILRYIPETTQTCTTR